MASVAELHSDPLEAIGPGSSWPETGLPGHLPRVLGVAGERWKSTRRVPAGGEGRRFCIVAQGENCLAGLPCASCFSPPLDTAPWLLELFGFIVSDQMSCRTPVESCVLQLLPANLPKVCVTGKPVVSLVDNSQARAEDLEPESSSCLA